MNDNIVNEILKITPQSIITMTVHEDTDVYRVVQNGDDSFDLKVNDKKVYGLSCCSVLEIIGVLIQDYATGIISDIRVE